MLYEITDTDDTGNLVYRIIVEAADTNAARIAAGKMQANCRTTKTLPGCHIWGGMVVANQ